MGKRQRWLLVPTNSWGLEDFKWRKEMARFIYTGSFSSPVLSSPFFSCFPVSSAGRTGNHAWLLCWLLLSKKHLSHVGLLGQVRICHCHHCFFPNILNSWSTCKATSSLMQDSMSFLSPFLPTAWFVETLPPRRHWCHLMCPYILSFPLLGGPQFPNKCRKKLID